MPFLAKTRKDRTVSKKNETFQKLRKMSEVTLTIECLALMRNQGGSDVFGKESSAPSVLRIALLQANFLGLRKAACGQSRQDPQEVCLRAGWESRVCFLDARLGKLAKPRSPP